MRSNYFLPFFMGSIFWFSSCQPKEIKQTEKTPAAYQPGSFGYDLNFLQNHDRVLVLKNESGQAQVLVSAKYQGKVFTSTANGLNGKSFGWINYKAFTAPKDPHMSAYGGENRLWLGPEGNKFSLYFKPGVPMEFANWVTPPAIDTESWNIISQNKRSASMQKEATFLNYAGTELKTRLTRRIQILENADIEEMLPVKVTGNLQTVGFTSNNAITNTGEQAWTKITGAPCLWLLDMFNPSPQTTIIIPHETKGTTKIATTDYFGEIPADRIKFKKDVLLFKADGKTRGKLGLGPERAKPIAGSYDAQNNVLTIIQFEVIKTATYLNQAWNTQQNPFHGDAVNAYNDGPLTDGSQMGPFYELESVSPAAFLSPGQTLHHQHSVFHFTGDTTALNQIAEELLGISLEQTQAAFK
ncbi:hypothetical protein AHMF7605_26945 [Adhaeribacter arboris]|uniref:Uncharacterized protein n=1 Tax=Adhaeribacter arboris TaxID=2072846 RepID=A0A2T2YMZ4_9BACT|nr:DUF6786 family protein [Adhaeribacter arboris]PSR56877.1 hypothetical protein AHMF7605_26945 [Adhaeribacter arboris]